MSIINDIKNDIRAARKMRLSWWGVICVIVGSFFAAWLFDYWGRNDLVLPVLNSIGVLGFLVALKWEMRAYVGFWIALAAVAALHVPLILLIPWTIKWVPAVAIAGIDTVDFCLMLAIFSVVRNHTKQGRTS